MEIYLIVYLLFNTIWSSWYAIHTANRSDNMPLWSELLIAAVPAVITGIITYKVTAKSQLNKNSDIIKELKESNERAFNAIKDDIGRGTFTSATLTEQHKNLQEEITRDFSAIQKRYEKEDATYDKYSRQQLDTDSAIKFLLEDYKRLIGENAEKEAYIRELEQKLFQYQGKRQELDLTGQSQSRGR